MDHLTAQPQLVVISVNLKIKLKDQRMTPKEQKTIIINSFFLVVNWLFQTYKNREGKI